MQKYTFHVSGTHCESCKILIEDVLSEEDIVKNVKVNLKRETVEVETDSEKPPEELAQILTSKIKDHGYALSLDKQGVDSNHEVLWRAVPIGLLFL